MFYQWLPIGSQQGIHYVQSGYTLLLWFDATCTVWAGDRTEEEITRTVNVSAYRVYADITVDNLQEDLLEYMRSRDFTRQPTPNEEELTQRYENHGREVFSIVRDGLNHLLTFARTEKGQYWLTPYKIDPKSTDKAAKNAVSINKHGLFRDSSFLLMGERGIVRKSA
jgi:hypothetical protein